MAQRKAGRKSASKKAAPKKKVGKKRKIARRKSSASKARTVGRPPAAAEKGAWSSARETQHQLKREAILRVASRLINLKGYAGMSLTDVADELEIRNASLYYYFESKEDLVFACYERAQRIVAETLEKAGRSRGSGLEAIERYVVSMREQMLESGELPLADRVWALRPAHMKAIIAAELYHRRHVGNLVERGIADGSIRSCDVTLTTAMLLSALHAVPRHYLSVDPREWPALHEEVLTTIRHLLAARIGSTGGP
jgi:AcrR family transcriptional regulator